MGQLVDATSRFFIRPNMNYLQDITVTCILLFQIAPAAKKLWGLEAKNDKSLALNRLNHDGVWRDPTWAAPGKYIFLRKP